MFPGVIVVENDTTEIVPRTQEYKVFYAGVFDRGPVNTVETISSVLDLKYTFGKHFELNTKEWMEIYNYFNYNNTSIDITRVVGENSLTASNIGGLKIQTEKDWNELPKVETIIAASSCGGWGNVLRVEFDVSKTLKIQTYLNNEFIETTEVKLNYPIEIKTDYFYAYILDIKEKTFNLSGGITFEPTAEQIQTAYEEANTEDTDYAFILANPNFINPAITLAEKKRAIAMVNYTGDMVNSGSAIYYEGEKKQLDPFTGKSLSVPIIGDILGMRTNLLNDYGLIESHCKRSYEITDIISFRVPDLRKLYDKNINSLGRGDYSYYSNSEILSNGKNLTQTLIYNDICKSLEKAARYFVFEFNDDITRSAFRKAINSKLETYKNSRAISNYTAICELSNQNASEPNSMSIDVYIAITGIAEQVKLKFTAYN